MLRLHPFEEVPAPVEERHPAVLPAAAHDDAPVAVGAEPGGGGVAEGRLVDGGVGDDQGVAVRLDPFTEVGVGEVGRDGEVLHLSVVLVDDAGVEDDRLVAREDGGRTGPAAEPVEGLGRVDGRFEALPVDEVLGDGVGPHDVAPYGSLWIVLVEQVVYSVEVHRPC